MVWIHEQPFTKREESAYRVLKKRLKRVDLAKETVKLMSLVKFLKDSKFTSPKEIQESAFHDKQKTRPIFDEKTAKTIFKSMKKRGGGVSEYPFTDYGIKEGTKKIVSFLPEAIQYPLNTIYSLVTDPISNLKENVPLVDLALGTLHTSTEVGVTTAADAAEAAGGPVGAAVALPFTAVAASIAAGTAFLEQDMGQAVAHVINVTPLFGSAFGKGLTKLESTIKDLENHPSVGSMIPVVSDYIESKTNPTGGNRFSTQRHKHTKWQKTRRNKSAKT